MNALLGPLLVLALAPSPTTDPGTGSPAWQDKQVVDQAKLLKAGWLKFFVEYVKWPEDGQVVDPKRVVIGVLGPNPYGEHIRKLAEVKAGKREIVLRFFDRVEKMTPCHILLVSALPAPEAPEPTAEIRLKRALEKLERAPVLVVSDHKGAALKGSMINYSVDKETNLINLEFNLLALKQARLQVSSKLLGLKTARIVKRLPEDE